VNHGGLDTKPRHVGDLGNIETADNGVTEFEIESGLSLSGPYSIIGKGGLRGRNIYTVTAPACDCVYIVHRYSSVNSTNRCSHALAL
jgi:hypothetical protein